MLSVLTPSCSVYPHWVYERHNGLIEDEGQETVCHQDLPICASLISVPVFCSHWPECWWKGMGQGHRAQAKVVSVPEIAGGYCQGMCLDVLFSLTFLVNLRETPNRAVWNHTKASPVVPFVHCVARICSVLAKSSTDPFNLRSDGHMLIFGSLTSTATNRASEDEARSNCTEKCVKMCTEKNAAKFANQCCSFLKYLTNWDLSQKTISMHKMTMKINSF